MAFSKKFQNLIQFDPIWSNLIQFVPIWSKLIQFDPTSKKDASLQHFWLKLNNNNKDLFRTAWAELAVKNELISALRQHKF